MSIITKFSEYMLIKEAPLSAWRDKTRYKGAEVQYPDMIFAKVSNSHEVKSAINFYYKIIHLFNKMFDRKIRIDLLSQSFDNFKIRITNEHGLVQKYYAYPTGKMGEHEVQDFIDKYIPGTSLRHELLHETVVPFIADKFELINTQDKSADKDKSIEDIQRQRAFDYSLFDVFNERVMEYFERLPDYKDTFPISTFIIDVTNRIKYGVKDKELSAEVVVAELKRILDEEGTTNKFLVDTLTSLYQHADYNVKDLSELNQVLGKRFEHRFNSQKNIFEEQLEYKIHQFTKYFNDEYFGVIKRLSA